MSHANKLFESLTKMGKFAKTSAPIGIGFSWHRPDGDIMMPEIKRIRFHIPLIFSLKSYLRFRASYLLVDSDVCSGSSGLLGFTRAGGELKNRATRAEAAAERLSKVQPTRRQR